MATHESTWAFRVTVWITSAAGACCVYGTAVTQKVNPGGPFISVFGEAIPFALGVAAIGAGLLGFQRMASTERLWSLGLFLVAVFVIAGAIRSVLDFWFWPHARGALFGL